MQSGANFTQWLDYHLQRSGISGKELAIQVGVSEATISRVKNGHVPLSARMRARLCAALNTTPKEIPGITRRAPVASMTELWSIQNTSYEDALIEHACQRGLFSANQLAIARQPKKLIPSGDFAGYTGQIKDYLAKGKAVLTIGPEETLNEAGLVPAIKIQSHTYSGHNLIVRAQTHLPSILEAPAHQNSVMMKLMFEYFECANLWQRSFERFAWQTKSDLAFLNILRQLSAEVTGLTPNQEVNISQYDTRLSAHAAKCAELGSLYALGSAGADCISGDLLSVSQAYSEPQLYKVLITQRKLEIFIENIHHNMPPTLSSNLCRVYKTSATVQAAEQFKRKWLKALAALEIPIFWQILLPENTASFNKSTRV